MYCKEILSDNAQIRAEVIHTLTQTDDGSIADYGIRVGLSCGGLEASHCVIPSVSPEKAYVDSLARQIEEKRISPAYAADFAETELSK